MRADGSDVERVTQGDMTVGGASWSPDSRALAFFEATVQDWHFLGRTFRSPVVVSQIGRVDVQTGARTLLTTGPGRKLTPQWLSDGRIAYVRSDTEEERSPGAGGGSRRPDFWSERIRFIDGRDGPAGIFMGVHWSGDGKQMVCHRFIEKRPPAVQQVFSPDPQFRLVRTGAFPSFSPDNQQIVYTTSGFAVGDAADYPSPFPVYIMSADGSNRHVLFQSADTNASGPVWSPRRDRIAFGLGVSQPRPGTFGAAQIAIVSPDGSGFRRLTPDDDANYLFPDWSPDGTRLVLRVASPSTKGLSILDVDSGRLTPLHAGLWQRQSSQMVTEGRRDRLHQQPRRRLGDLHHPSRRHRPDAADEQPRQRRARGVVARWTMARLLQRARRLQGRNGAWRRWSDRDRRLRDARGRQRCPALDGRCRGRGTVTFAWK